MPGLTQESQLNKPKVTGWNETQQELPLRLVKAGTGAAGANRPGHSSHLAVPEKALLVPGRAGARGKPRARVEPVTVSCLLEPAHPSPSLLPRPWERCRQRHGGSTHLGEVIHTLLESV